MSAPSSCLSDEQLRALLQGAPEATSPEWMAHLNDCVRCRDRLDALTGGGERLQGMHRPTPAVSVSPPLRDAMDRLKASEGTIRIGAEETTPLLGTKVRYLGDYEIIEELGRGGMGVVYRARQLSLRREVAIKVILAGQLASPADVRRFHVEAEAAAKLDHPNIVPIFEIGEHEGHHFFSMKLVEGGSLAGRITPAMDQRSSADKLDIRDSALVIAQIARAVHYAHQRGVLHRDLKPSNILIDRDGQPHLTDFGLAKLLEHDSGLTRSAAIMGTPNYLAPEMAAGKVKEVTIAADVFSLGAVLYELLTGRPPFKEENVAATLQKVIHTEPTLPRVLNPAVTRDLETICLKCLEKEPTQRYSSAEALAEELNRFERGEPIISRRVSTPERVWRWSRRKPALAGALAGLVLMFVLGFAGVLWQWRRAEQNALSESRQRSRAENVSGRLAMQQAEDRFKSGEASTALAYLARVLRENPTNQAAAERVMSALSSRVFPRPVTPVLKHESEVSQAAFTPDGLRVVTGTVLGQLQFWDAQTGTPLSKPIDLHGQRGSNGPCRSLEFSPDGRLLFVAAGERGQLLDAQTGEPLTQPLMHTAPPGSVAKIRSGEFSADGKLLATSASADTVCVWDVPTGKRLTEINLESFVVAAQFTPDRRRLFIASSNRVEFFEAATGRRLNQAFEHTHIFTSAALSPDGQHYFTALQDSADRSVWVWDANSGQPRLGPLKHRSSIGDAPSVAAFSPDGQRLVTGGVDFLARLWDVNTGEAIGEPLNNEWVVGFAQFSRDGHRLVTFGKGVRVWDAQTGHALMKPIEHGRPLQISRDGQKLLTVGRTTVTIWNISVARQWPVPVPFVGGASDVSFSADGKRVEGDVRNSAGSWDRKEAHITGLLKLTRERTVSAFPGIPSSISAGSDTLKSSRKRRAFMIESNMVYVADAETKQRLVGPLIHDGKVKWGRFSDDEKLLLTVDELVQDSEPRAIRVWDATSGKLTLGPMKDLSRTGFSPDGKYLLAVNNGLRVWDARTGQPAGDPLVQKEEVLAWAFSPDGRLLATALFDSSVRILDWNTRRLLTDPIRLDSWIEDVVFSSDGQRLLTTTRQPSVRVWDVATGLPRTEPLELHLPNGSYPSVRAPAFTPDGAWIIAGTHDKTAWLWELPRSTDSVPSWLPDLAEAIGGKRVNDRGVLESVDADALHKIKEHWANASPTNDVEIWVKWLFADPATRTVSPTALVTVPDYVQRRLKDHTVQSLREAVLISPTNALAFAHLAQRLSTRSRAAYPRAAAEADWLSQYAAKLAPDDPEVRQIRETVVEKLRIDREAKP